MRRRSGVGWGHRAFAAVLALLAVPATSSPPGPTETAVTEALGDLDTKGFARAMAPRRFSFPADHGPHPEFRTEWWYFTGNLDAENGRPFGFELTFFRIGLAPKPVPSNSAWRAHQIYMAHFALTDIAGKRFHAHERLSRAALGLAGADIDTLRVWLEDWSAEPATAAGFPLRLRASEDRIAIDLSLEAGKPPVLHGNQGLSQKSLEAGNASYYYSMTRLPTVGTIGIDGKTLGVKGTSWLDREWSTSALGKDQVGWDWFALQFSDDSELMFYRLRRRDGATDPMSAGTLVARDGSTHGLDHGDLEIEALDHWETPGAAYPARWRLRIPREGLDVVIDPLLADQELKVSVRYWEGAVTLRGVRNGIPIAGRGYVELTGYASTK